MTTTGEPSIFCAGHFLGKALGKKETNYPGTNWARIAFCAAPAPPLMERR